MVLAKWPWQFRRGSVSVVDAVSSEFLNTETRRSCSLKRRLLRDFLCDMVHVVYLSWSVQPVYGDWQLSFRGRVTNMRSQPFHHQNRIKTEEVALNGMAVNWFKSQSHVQKESLANLYFTVLNSERIFFWACSYLKGISFWRNCGAVSVGKWYTKIWFVNGVDNVNWPPNRDWKADVSSVSPSSERIDELWVM